MSYFETFEAWWPDKASHFESFRGWRPYKASHFESSGGCRLREVSHGESFGCCGHWKVSHGVGPGLDGLGPSAVLASGGAFLRCLDLGMVPRGPLVGGWICGRTGPLYSMVRGCHEAWQGAGVTKYNCRSGKLIATSLSNCSWRVCCAMGSLIWHPSTSSG